MNDDDDDDDGIMDPKTGVVVVGISNCSLRCSVHDDADDDDDDDAFKLLFVAFELVEHDDNVVVVDRIEHDEEKD